MVEFTYIIRCEVAIMITGGIVKRLYKSNNELLFMRVTKGTVSIYLAIRIGNEQSTLKLFKTIITHIRYMNPCRRSCRCYVLCL
jgi:hypothetical protein